MSLADPLALSLVAVTFLFAGLVKGVVGLGLPTVSLAILTATLGLHPAMALMLAPSMITNVWQAFAGDNGTAILRRFWLFMGLATVSVWIGARALTAIDVAYLSGMFGLLLCAYALIGLIGPPFAVPASWQRWTAAPAGAVSGLAMGMTGSFVVPGVIYLQALGLPRDMLIQTMGIAFTLCTVGLALGMGGQNLLNLELGAVSAAAIVPALLGMAAGQRLRRRLDEAAFRKVLFAALLAIGAYIAGRALLI